VKHVRARCFLITLKVDQTLFNHLRGVALSTYWVGKFVSTLVNISRSLVARPPTDPDGRSTGGVLHHGVFDPIFPHSSHILYYKLWKLTPACRPRGVAIQLPLSCTSERCEFQSDWSEHAIRRSRFDRGERRSTSSDSLSCLRTRRVHAWS
jgi:hypothetical protein